MSDYDRLRQGERNRLFSDYQFTFSNKINFLPEEPLILKSLRSLDMSYNHIRVVPDLLLSQTHALETLALSGNEIGWYDILIQ